MLSFAEELDTVCGLPLSRYHVDAETCASFGYLFPQAPERVIPADRRAKLTALELALSVNAPDYSDPAAPALQMFEGFIGADILAGTASAHVFELDAQTSVLSRQEVVLRLSNMRRGSLTLDSVYGEKSFMRAKSKTDQLFIERIAELKRCPSKPAKMWIPEARKEAEAQAHKMLAAFEDQDFDSIDPTSQGFQRALLALHNLLVDQCQDAEVLAEGATALFAWAQNEVRKHYQWFVINRYLPARCDSKVLQWVLDHDAPAYGRFYRENPQCGSGHMGLPMEFAAAAFCRGNALVRRQDDWLAPLKRASEAEFVEKSRADIATLLTELSQTGGQADETQRNQRKLPTLHRNQHLNLPTAQDCLDQISIRYGLELARIPEEDLAEMLGADAQLMCQTPLCLYLINEARLLGSNGAHGPLGSFLLADSLAGLLIYDHSSYWNEFGSGSGRWHPRDTRRALSGVHIDVAVDMELSA
jgi:hypothetical protein